MAVLNNAMDGMRLALGVGFTLMIVNGLVARFSPSRRTLNEIVSGWVAPMTKGGVA
jgi:hypothetical protein